jgi:hypothetical protein
MIYGKSKLLKIDKCKCGSDADVKRLNVRFEQKTTSPFVHIVQCLNCGKTIEGRTKNETIRTWNNEISL